MTQPTKAALSDCVTFSAVSTTDFDELVALRIAAMRASLEHVGRFDPERARERLRKSFYPEHSEFIVIDGQRVGFYTFRPADDGFHLDHLYVHPTNKTDAGNGSKAICRVSNVLRSPSPDPRRSANAGVTLAAYLLPAALGDASLAGLPPQAGLYACLFGGLVFWLFCSSRQTAITVTSAISLLIGSTLGGMADGDPARYAAMAACTALLVAVIAFLAWLARAGTAVNFISETVMLGFKAGVALHLASTQLPKLFGIKGGHGDFWERMGVFIRHVGETHRPSLLIGAAALAILFLGKKLLPNKPVALFVVVGGILAASWLGLGASGVKLLGEVPKGIPLPSLPVLSHADIRELLPLALACFLLGAVESAAIGRMFAEKHGYRFDANQELLALSGANLASGLGQGFPISGGMSQSLVNESGGAKTPLSGLLAAAIMLVIALFFTDLLQNLPQPVLAAIVLMAVLSLFKAKALAHLWKVHRSEFFVAMAALAGVLWAGLLQGVLIGAVISMVLLIRRASRRMSRSSGASRGRTVTRTRPGTLTMNPRRVSSSSASRLASSISTRSTSSTRSSPASTPRPSR
jgi:MFS superfamily sulfate permease-like transporter